MDYRKKWKKENPDKISMHTKKYQNKPLVREIRNIQRSIRSKQPKGKFYTYKKSAVKRNLEFDISFEDFVLLLSYECTYCGEPKANGIDRVDNSIGYIAGNMVSCCSYCNFMKRDKTRDEFINHCVKVYNHQN